MLLLSKERESSAELSRHIFLKTGTSPHVTLQGLGGRLGETETSEREWHRHGLTLEPDQAAAELVQRGGASHPSNET